MDKYLRLKNVSDKQFNEVKEFINKKGIESKFYCSAYEPLIEAEAEDRLDDHYNNNDDLVLKENESYDDFMNSNIQDVIDALDNDDDIINSDYIENDIIDVLKDKGYYASEEKDNDNSIKDVVNKAVNIADAVSSIGKMISNNL